MSKKKIKADPPNYPTNLLTVKNKGGEEAERN